MNAGHIEYTVSVETKASIDAAAKVNKSLDGTEKQINKTDKSVKGLNKSLSPLASAIRNAFSRSSASSINSTEKAMGGALSMAKKLAAVIGVTLSVRAIGGMISSNIKLASSTLNVAEKLGTTTEAVSKLRYVVGQTAGMVSGEFDVALQRMSRRLAEAAQGGGVAKDAITELGLDAKRLSDADPADAFKQIMEQMSKLPSQADRVRMAFKFFDSGGVKLAQTAKGGAQAIDEMSKKLEEMGGVIGTDTAKKASELEAKLNDMQERFKAVGMQITNDAMPALEDFARLVGDPAVLQSLSDIAASMLKLGEWAVKGAADTAGAMRWIGESIAAAMHGPALDDIVRVEDHIVSLEQQAKHLKSELDTFKLLRMNPFKSDDQYQADYDKIMNDLAMYKKARDEFYSPAPVAPPQDSGHATSSGAPLSNTGSGGTTGSTKAARDANAELVKSLELINATMGMSKEAATLYKMELDGATGAQLNQAKALLESIDLFKQAEEAEASLTTTVKSLQEQITLASLEGAELAQMQAQLSLGEYATPDQIEQVRELAKQLEDINRLAELTDAAAGLNTDSAITEKFEQEKANLLEMHELKLLTDAEYAEQKMLVERSMHEELTALAEERFRNQSAMNELLINSLDSISGHATDAFMEFATGAKTGKDAALAMAQAIGQSVTKAIVDMGVQMAVNAVKEKIFAAQSAATAVTTGATITAAYAPAAATASIATMGGAAAAGTTAMLSSMGAMVASALSFGGGRKHGGGVDGNSFYRVNEGGKPEIFNGSDGHQYMMPNQRGEVVSNKDATGGGAVVIVNVNEDASRAGQVQESQSNDQRVIDIFVANVMGDGQAASAIQNKFGLAAQGR